MRDELSDFEWAAIKPLLPNKSRGFEILFWSLIAYARHIVSCFRSLARRETPGWLISAKVITP